MDIQRQDSPTVLFPESWKELKVALSHDWLTGMRGGEKVLEVLCRGFPSAPIFTLLADAGAVSQTIRSHAITSSWLQRIPGIARHYRYLLPLFPQAVDAMSPPDADILISTSHCAAKGLRTSTDTMHLCYCFTPMRYAWTFYEEYFGKNRLKKAVLSPMLTRLRDWDRRNSERVDRFVTLSNHVKKRIADFYGRNADVVYPPVDTDFYTPDSSSDREDFDLIVSALVPYKRIDLAVAAYTKLGHPLKVVGVGTEFETLKKSAGRNVEFLGWQSNESIRSLYRRCRCLVFPGEEDFGIVPVEAQACGRPVVAYGRGGALETVAANVSGVFFEEQNPNALLAAVEDCAGRAWDTAVIRANAERFGIQQFVDGLGASIRGMQADPTLR